MLPIERQHRILKILQSKNLSKLDEIHKQIPGVSVSTLRRDIKTLKNKGKVEYLFGGAVRLTNQTSEISFAQKALTHKKAKEKIANLALQRIEDGNSIYVDSGTTCTLLLYKMINKKVTVYTTNTQVCNIAGNFKANIVLVGGNYNGVTSSVSGSLTDSILNDLNFDKSFFGINAISINRGFTTPSVEEAVKKRMVLKHTAESYVLADSSKFGMVSGAHAFDINQASIISDSNNVDLSRYTKIIYN